MSLAIFVMCCFWGVERLFWQRSAFTVPRLAILADIRPILPTESVQRPDRPCRSGKSGVCPTDHPRQGITGVILAALRSNPGYALGGTISVASIASRSSPRMMCIARPRTRAWPLSPRHWPTLAIPCPSRPYWNPRCSFIMPILCRG